MITENLIVKMVFGSHLYGTNTKESDTDYKGVYMPNFEDIVLQRVKKNINTNTKKEQHAKNEPEDMDTEIFSLHEFIKLSCAGQTVALDMLHAPKEFWLEHNPIWEQIVEKRHFFYTKSLQAFVGYARKQAAKYGIKGSRLSDLKEVMEHCSKLNQNAKLGENDIWEHLPELGHVNFVMADGGRQLGQIEFYQVLGRKFGKGVQVKFAMNCFKDIDLRYGERARAAERSEGVDWKAMSHAIRAADQCIELFQFGTITFPRPNAAYLKAVKEGVYEYRVVAKSLEDRMAHLESRSKKSNYPETVDREYWDQFIIKCLGIYG